MVDFYSAATRSFQEDLDRIEKNGRRTRRIGIWLKGPFR
jgi:hypothetical protein